MSAGLIRVVHLITRLELGGAQQNTLYTVSHLNRSLFECFLVSGEGGILDAEAQQIPNLTLHFCPSLIREIRPFQDRKAYQLLKDLLKRLKPDIVHTHSSKAGILGRIAAREAGVPVIVHTFHGFGFHRYQNPIVFRAYVAAERKAAASTTHMIFVSRDNWKWARELGLTRNSTASLIRSGVDSSPLLSQGESFRDQWGIAPDRRMVGMIACLKPQKDPLTFVAAADLVTRKLPDVHFVLAGDGEMRDAVLRRIGRMKHAERFHFLGWIRNTEQLLSELNLVVLTSLWEGLPRVIPESTVAGIPVIASDIEGNREIIHPGRNGVLAIPGNVIDFATKIEQALQQSWTVDPELSAQIRNEFDIDQMVRSQEELYCNLNSYLRV